MGPWVLDPRRTGAGTGAAGETCRGWGVRARPGGVQAWGLPAWGRCTAALAGPCECRAAGPGQRRWACPPPCARSSRSRLELPGGESMGCEAMLAPSFYVQVAHAKEDSLGSSQGGCDAWLPFARSSCSTSEAQQNPSLKTAGYLA